MAGILKDSRSGIWTVSYRYGGKRYHVSTKTKSQQEAQACRGRVVETLRLLQLGAITMPPDADPAAFIASGGNLTQKPKIDMLALTGIGEICDAYFADQVSKAPNTLDSEKTHLRHLKRVLKEGTRIAGLTIKEMQDYVDKRRRQKWHGKLISGKTIRKELVTFTQVWAWAKQRSFVKKDCPVYDEEGKWIVNIEKPAEKEKFQTWDQITKRISRGDLTAQKNEELWASLFLDNEQIIELLDFVKMTADHDFIYPLFVFAAYSGARRSELCRSEIEDFDFDNGRIKIREKKRRKKMSSSYRFVDLHPRLAAVMQDWFDTKHPGGAYTITLPAHMPRRKTKKVGFNPITTDEAHHHFKKTFAGSKWEVLRGFHVLRHSFGSNLARAGVSRDQIADWMGHTTEEMKELYQHLFPQDGASKIAKLI